MGKNNVLPTLLITGIIALGSAQGTLAATTASQTVTGTLGPVRQVITNGGNIAATISEATGALSLALNPGFTLITNTSGQAPVALTAASNTSGGAVNALFGTGATGSTFILLTNSTVLPAPAAVTDAASGAPSAPSNPNVIAYPVDAPTDIAGQLAYAWDGGLSRWTGILTHKGNTNTLLNIPATTPRPSTFSIADDSGTYQSTVTLSFIED